MFFPDQTHHKNTNPTIQELKPRSQEHKWKQEEKIKLNTNKKNEEQWTQSNCQTQIHHNRPAPSTQPNRQNSSNLRENPNSTPQRSSNPTSSDLQQTSKKTQSNKPNLKSSTDRDRGLDRGRVDRFRNLEQLWYWEVKLVGVGTGGRVDWFPLDLLQTTDLL